MHPLSPRALPRAPAPGPRRALVAGLACLLAGAALAAAPAFAQTAPFPNKPVRILVGSAAGGGTDVFSRIIAGKLQEMWGQPVIVENRTGASASIAADLVAKSPPDGHTVVTAIPNSHTIGPHVMKFPYDPLADFTPITLIMEIPSLVVVSADLPVSSMKELVAYMKANPDKANYYSSGIGSTQHLAGEMFNIASGLKVVHVPYKGSAPAIADLMSGAVTMGIDPVSATLGQLKAGRIKALAVAAPTRVSSMPNIPTTAEAGFPGVEMLTWYGLLGPANLPRPIVEKWQQDVAKVMAMPDVKERVAAVAGEPRASTPDAFSAFLREQNARMSKLVRDANIKDQ
jgi:tripartite-type tricarboxylate transporter receptor subunit TctC